MQWSRKKIIATLRKRKRRGVRINPGAVPKVLYAMCRYYFGTYDKALRAAGFDPKKVRLLRRRVRHRSPEWAIEQLRRLKAKGKPVYQGYLQRKKKKVAMAIVHHVSGGWKEAVRAAGFDPEIETAWWTPKKLIRWIWNRKLAGLPLNHKALPRHMSEKMYRFFGSWRNAIDAAGLNPADEQKKARREPEELISTLHRLKSRGDRLSHSTLRDAKVVEAIRRKFGSVKAGLRAAGFDPREEQTVPKWSRPIIIAAVEDLHTRGQPLNAMTVPRLLYKAGVEYFGNWSKTLKAAGFDPSAIRKNPPRSRRWVVDEIQALKSRGERISPDYLMHHHKKLANAIYRRFRGGWREAVKKAGFDPWAEYARKFRSRGKGAERTSRRVV
jgi:hypothetical protein